MLSAMARKGASMHSESLQEGAVEYERLAESAIADGEQRFRNVLERLPAGAYTCDSEGLITYYNQHAVSLWGRAPRLNDSEDRFCGSFKLYSPDGSPIRHEQCWMALALHTRRGYNGQEIIVQRPDGRRLAVLAYANPICDESGKLLGAVNVLVDISERKRVENAIRESRDAAEAASRAKDRFLAMLSHELRAPLSPVVMIVAAMENNPELPAKFREDLAVIRRNLDLEVKLIDDLLDVSRVVAGKLRLQMQAVRVHDVLRHVIDNCQSELSGKRLRLHCALDAAYDYAVADAGRLQQVFWNLLRNATKFTPDGGDVFIRTWNSRGNSQLFVEVRDTGVGIRPEAMQRIFEVFEQGEDRTTGQFGGLGLGLSIAKAVVEMHGGSIAAMSDGPDQGATFTVRLNTESEREGKNRAALPSIRQAHPSGGWRVLIVEDHRDTAFILTRLLQSVGYHVQTANSMATALQMAAAERFDLVISDIGLPDATGYELMLQLKKSYGAKGIALSGFGMEKDVQRSRQAGFEEHLVKPVNLSQLQEAIQRLLSGS
jgi:PAS domain S-box-containing protein